MAQEPSIEGAFPWEQSGYLQGDIIFKPGTRNGLRNTQQYWTRAIVPYYIDNSFSNLQLNFIKIYNKLNRPYLFCIAAPAEKKVIRGGIDEYHNRTCIRFRPYKKGDTNWVEFKSNKLGCFSSDIGMKKNGAQVINLQHKNKLGGGCIFHGTVVHEIMHALGFYHQQSASDRDQYVTVHLENVKSGHEHNFDKEGPNVVTDFGVAYDYQSIMHYSNYAFSKNKLPTLKPKVLL